jgi:simple sugar transport system ATP-binding protein
MEAICKFYGSVEALRGVDLELEEHEILGLVGDNAAGKSTLIKILAGAERPTSGRVRIRGKTVHFRNPSEGRLAGIETVHQTLALCENLNAVANVSLGREARRGGILGRLGFLDMAGMEELTLHSLHQFDATLRPGLYRPTEMLSGGQKQTVAIVRAAAYKAQVVIMDEPTANLGAANSSRVLDMMRMLRDAGAALILITHRFNDVFAVTDRIEVLRTGMVAGIRRTSETSAEELLWLMTMGEVGGDERAGATAQTGPLPLRNEAL